MNKPQPIHITLKRTRTGEGGTFGTIQIIDTDIICLSLELPWKDNQDDISCIPTGTYIIGPYLSPKYKRIVYRIYGVPDRDYIEIHPANHISQLKGCAATGTKEGDAYSREGKLLGWGVVGSTAAFDKLMGMLDGDYALLTITEVY